MCITQVKLTTLMKKKKILYLHLIPHFQRIQMYHIIPKNIVSNLFQFEVVHEENIFWDHAWLQIYDKSYYWFWQVPKHSMQLFPPLLYTTPCLFREDAKTWMGSRVSMQEFGTLWWKPSFKDCNKRDAIMDVIIYKTCGRIYKEANKTRVMLHIELSHGLKHKKKHLHLPKI
jgi:hypothetical protein